MILTIKFDDDCIIAGSGMILGLRSVALVLIFGNVDIWIVGWSLLALLRFLSVSPSESSLALYINSLCYHTLFR